MPLYPDLSWFINEDGWPYLYRRDVQRRDFPNDFHTPYDTAEEACKVAEITVEDLCRSL